MSSEVWQFIGVGLLAWAAFDIYAGHTWLHRKIVRREEPEIFWVMIVIWLGAALWCFI